MKATAFREPANLRAWLEANGISVKELPIRCYKSHARKKGVTYPDARTVQETIGPSFCNELRPPVV